MEKTCRLTSKDRSAEVIIDRGELISYKKNGEELIHQKGDPGWSNSDTEMFPVVGPTEKFDYSIKTRRGPAVQDLHGLLRELDYSILNKAENSVEYQKNYAKNTKVRNSKYPEKSIQEFVFWPYDFEFKKKYFLSNDALRIAFEITGEKGMPYMLGYHPAFKLSGNNTEHFRVNKKQISLQDVLDAGSAAYPLLNTEEIILHRTEGCDISLSTKGFSNLMLWTEVPGMVCIEPITAYPDITSSEFREELFRTCLGRHHFEVLIRPFD